MADRVRMNTLSLATTALAQTPSFWHAGADLLRSKSLDRNSYDSGDWFNTLDWTGADNGFGHGLPPKPDNEAKWSFMKPLLADPALKPTAADVGDGLSRGRRPAETPLLDAPVPARLGRPDQPEGLVPPQRYTGRRSGVIVMRIDDTVGPERRPRAQGSWSSSSTPPAPPSPSKSRP